MARMLASGSSAPAVCAGLGDGILHMFAYFVPLYHQWMTHLAFFAKYSVTGLVDCFLEFCILALVIVAAVCIESVQVSRENPAYLWFFSLLNLCCLMVWLIRYLINATTGTTKRLRRESCTLLLWNIVGALLLVAAMICASYPDNDDTYEATLALLILLGAVYPLSLLCRGLFDRNLDE